MKVRVLFIGVFFSILSTTHFLYAMHLKDQPRKHSNPLLKVVKGTALTSALIVAPPVVWIGGFGLFESAIVYPVSVGLPLAVGAAVLVVPHTHILKRFSGKQPRSKL